jgi:murein DD-endopeptidase MepM/ murein hydrolase activator NlpD
MKRLLLVALVALAAATSASADPLPSADTPNLASVLFPQLLVAPAQPQQLTYYQLLPIWQAAGQARWGTDATGDGLADPWNAEDAIYSAARYLAATGGTSDIAGAVFAYNHAQWYVDQVLQLAQQFDAGGAPFAAALGNAQQQLDAAKQLILDANARLLDAQNVLAKLQQREETLVAKAQAAPTFSDQLSAQKLAVQVDFRVQAAQAEVNARQVELQSAQDALTAARDQSSVTGFASGAGQLLGSPSYSGAYVFPVGGGPGQVFVGHSHHDYPAADIAAPEGSQLYALADGTVTAAWPSGNGDCGIGFSIATVDGLSWTYCHLSYLEPSVMLGTTLVAGQPVGLVGHTGHATGPHLHLQLNPSTGYPQDEPWFQAFAGTAFTWLDTTQANAAPTPVFAVVGGTAGPTRALDSAATASGPVVYFTASGG